MWRKSKIQILSNKLLKYLLKLDQDTPSNDLHKTIKILKVEDLVNVNILSFVKNAFMTNVQISSKITLSFKLTIITQETQN